MENRTYEQNRVDEVIAKIKTQRQALLAKEDQVVQQAKQTLAHNGEIRVKDGNETAMFESSVEQNQQEKDLMLYNHELDRIAHRTQVLSYMEAKPYFGRVDFIDEGDETTLYFGIGAFDEAGKTYVTDWRTPIATIYYDGGLGEKKFQAVGVERSVNVLHKRQFVIEDGQIEIMADTDETITDEALLAVLNQEASTKMRQIVSTIQSEQNAIIRDEKHPYLLINGVAGSGKTAVLMQRIAYLMYQKRNYLQTEDFLMITPSKVFSEYVANVLPSLGEDDVYRYEMPLLIAKLSPVTIIDETNLQIANYLASLQGIEAFKQALMTVKPIFKPIMLSRHEQLITVKQLERLYQQIAAKYSPAKKLQILKQHLLKQVQKMEYKYQNSAEVEERIELEGGELYEELMAENGTLTIDEVKEQMAAELAEKKFALAKKMIKNLHFIDYQEQYLTLLAGMLNGESPEYLVAVRQALANDELSYVNALYYMMMYRLFLGKELKQQYLEIFVDEVQEQLPVELAYLQAMYPKARFTLCGDINQAINVPETITDLATIFAGKLHEVKLLRSYRNTAEITAFASAIIQDEIIPVERSGQKPIFVEAKKAQEALADLAQEKIVIITPTEEQALALYQQYQAEYQLTYVSNATPSLEAQRLIMPLAIAKGLEFDNVILTGTSTNKLDNSIYTMVTRAMQRLYIIEESKPLWLQEINSNLYETR